MIASWRAVCRGEPTFHVANVHRMKREGEKKRTNIEARRRRRSRAFFLSLIFSTIRSLARSLCNQTRLNGSRKEFVAREPERFPTEIGPLFRANKYPLPPYARSFSHHFRFLCHFLDSFQLARGRIDGRRVISRVKMLGRAEHARGEAKGKELEISHHGHQRSHVTSRHAVSHSLIVS